MIEVGYPLDSAMCSMLIHSIGFCCGLRGKRCIRVIRNRNAAILCSSGWLKL
jgi:hypothetical protein